MSQSIADLKATSIRGKASEEKTKSVLRALFKEGIITNYRKTDPLSVDDRNGIDFYIAIHIKGKRVELPLQVKSSLTGILNHTKKSDIYAVNGQADNLREQIIELIQIYKSTFDENPLAPKSRLVEDYKAWETYDYHCFKFLDFNRKVKKEIVKKLKKSLQKYNLMRYNPVWCFEDYTIFDGQHRFQTLKELGEPIYFIIVPGLDAEHLIALNTAVTPWAVGDYIDCFASLGKEAYTLFKKCMGFYGLGHSLISVMVTGHNTSLSREIKEGKLRFGEEEALKVDQSIEYLNLLSRIPFFMNVQFIRALWKLKNKEFFENAHLLEQVERYGPSLAAEMSGTLSHKKACDFLERLYNRKSRKPILRFTREELEE